MKSVLFFINVCWEIDDMGSRTNLLIIRLPNSQLAILLVVGLSGNF